MDTGWVFLLAGAIGAAVALVALHRAMTPARARYGHAAEGDAWALRRPDRRTYQVWLLGGVHHLSADDASEPGVPTELDVPEDAMHAGTIRAASYEEARARLATVGGVVAIAGGKPEGIDLDAC